MMSRPSILLALFLALAVFSAAAQAGADDEINRASAQLEADLKKTLETSPNGAKALLALVDHYYQHGRVFGLVRNARKFAAAQSSHPRHKEVMMKLLDGLVITSRHKELTTAARQFLTRYNETPEAAHVERQLASTYEVTNKNGEAAAAYNSVSVRLGRNGIDDGIKALALYRGIENAAAFKSSAELAERLLDILPADGRATEIGFLGFRAAQRYSDWARSNSIATKTLAKKSPIDKARRYQLLIAIGDNHSHLGQRSNALASYRQALAQDDSAEARKRIVDTLAASAAKPDQLKPEVAAFLKRFPNHESRWEVAATLAESYARAGDIGNALAAAERILAGNSEARKLRSNMLGWLGEKPTPANLKRAEAVLKSAIARNANDAWRLRWTLAFDLYRDRLKNTELAKTTARELLFKYPGDSSGMKSALAWLFGAAASEKEFQDDVARAAAAAQTFAHLAQYRGILGAWATDAKGKKELRERAKFALGKYNASRDSTLLRKWREAEKDRGAGREARDWLLAQKLSPEQRRAVLHRQATGIRRYAHAKHRAASIPFFRDLHAIATDKLAAAKAWQEAAANYGTADDIRAATGAVLAAPPANDHYLWRSLAAGALRAKDADLARKILSWINASEKANGLSMNYAGEIGDSLFKLELKNEANSFWRTHAIPGSDHYEALHCTGKLLEQIPKENSAQRIALISKMAAPETDQHGGYASWLADEYFRAGDFAKFEKVLADARKRQDHRPFRHWGLGEWPAQGWLDHCWKSEEMPDDQKALVFRAVRDLDIGRTSSAAALSLLAIGRSEALSPTAQLLALARATRIGDRSAYAWDRMWPAAQSMVARGNYPQAAVLLTGMLGNITDVDNTRKENARALVRKAYAGMGSLGFDIDNDSPIAPLLHISLHRRLGDEALAVETYHKNRSLFDSHRDQLPAEIVAFAADIHINEGGDEAHERAEDILRAWTIKHSEDPKIEAADKALIALLLAKNYHRAGRYEVARAEYTTVVNRHPNSDAAIEAKFGIGETFMAQKIFDKAEEIFNVLGETRIPKIVLRSDFLRGVLAVRRDDREAARTIFRDVLARMPDIELADRTLFELAEVYGLEQRFLDQLDLLRTVGRLGRDSKRWHVPGRALSIVVQDTDLGISRGHSKIPVVIRTDPGGDEENAFLTSGGAGKGLFMGELATTLGGAVTGDNVLQVTGADLITVDYPEEFKKGFRFDLLANNQIRLGADASFEMASARILPDDESGFTDELRQELEDQQLDKRKSSSRPSGQIKPGNLIYFRTEDPDRNLGEDADRLPVRLVASSGDKVEVTLDETGPHTGVFEGSVRSGELPAGALASDQAIGHSPLMAIDSDPLTAWLAEPDGVAPKWLLVDMKALNEVDTVTVYTPDPKKGAPVRLRLEGSHDGRYFYHLAEFPVREPDKIPAGEFGAMRQRVWKVADPAFTTWSQVIGLAAKTESLADEPVTTLAWQRELPADVTDEAKKAAAGESFAVLWQGKFLQPKNGAVRITVAGTSAAIMVDGRVVLNFADEEPSADVYLDRGLHDFAIFATVTATETASAQRARENPNSPAVVILPFSKGDLDLESPVGVDLADVALDRAQPTVSAAEGTWTFKLAPIDLRHVRITVDEYLGETLAINQVDIVGGDTVHIPTAADLLALSRNNVLEIAPGDTVTGSYIDEFTNGGIGRNRVLSASLTATYYNGIIRPISYDFFRASDGSVRKSRKDLLRIDPGERITIEVTDYDMDITGGEDSITIKVIAPGGGEIELQATEIGANAGVFRTQIDTAAVPEDGKLPVKPGDHIYLRYRDPQNTFPGHPIEREAVVYVRTPTEGQIRIVETRVIRPPEGSSAAPSAIFLPTSESLPDTLRGVAYDAPLTIEVIDPDAARDNRSSVVVTLNNGEGDPIRVACHISSAYGEADPTLAEVNNPALHQGRFVGQVPLRLGGPGSPSQIPITDGVPTGLIGKVLPPEQTEETGTVESPTPAATVEDKLAAALVSVFNITGKDIISATYNDADRPDGNPLDLSERAKMISDGTITITDKEYEEPAEILFLGERIFLQVADADRDLTDERDSVEIAITTSGGEEELVTLEETLSHSGIFTASFGLAAQAKPTKGNLSGTSDKRIEAFFDELLTATYTDETPASSTSPLPRSSEIMIARGTDGIVAAFSKIFNDEDLAIQTQFHIAESYFELFKSHLELKRDKEASADLKAGRKVLRELAEDYPDPRYTPRVEYLLGNFSQEMKEWDAAIESYNTIVRDFPEHTLAADAQYKLGQCYEKAGQFDDALEAYVTLAASYPNSPLIASVMMRINEHFYRDENFIIAASVAEKFLERFDSHEHAPRMAFRAGQCYYKAEEFDRGGETFDEFVKKFPDDDLAAQSLFWAAESYRMAGKIPEAFWRYNRCRTDFPESEAAKYSRGRLALPELLAQFEREAAAIEAGGE